MLETFLARLLCVIVLFVVGCPACSRRGPQPSPPSEPAVGENPGRPAPSRARRWRLVEARELERVVLWVSHILIRHEGSDTRVSGSVFDWTLDEARALANEVAAELDAHPARFAELARRHSEDTTSASLGGSLGGTRASDFRFESEVLDALAGLHPGETSGVIETRHGFQIFRLGAVPHAGEVSGEHIVIGHDSASWLRTVGAPPAARTRSEALALARRIHAELRSNPDSFPDAVRRHSDHPDRTVGGDFGTWSVREPTPQARAVQALRELEIGAVSPPFESHYGIEIVRRTPARERPLYAMEAVKVAFVPGDAESKLEAQRLARELVEVIVEDPSRFDELRRKYCCAAAESWFEGRDEPGLSSALAKLAAGEIGRVPVEQYSVWVIPRRVDPSRVEHPLEAKFVVPTPERPRLEWVLQWLPAPLLAKEIAVVAAKSPGLASTERRRELLRRIARSTAPAAESPGSEVPQDQFAANVRELFEAAETAEHKRTLEARIGVALAAEAPEGGR